MNFTLPATLLKSETIHKTVKLPSGKTYSSVPHVYILASDESMDQDNDQMLSKCFTDPVKEFFLKYGIFDWDHLTLRGSTDVEKGTAMVGTPTKFWEERVKGAPVQLIEGFLHPGNPYVDSTIVPALKSKSDRIGVSVGGKILAYDNNEYGGKSIGRIFMNHLAFTPLFKSINLNTRVELTKSQGINGEIHNFPNMNALIKSLEAGYQTDSSAMTGAQALQTQNLEGGSLVDETILLHEKAIKFVHDKDKKIQAAGRNVLYDLLSYQINFTKESVKNRGIYYGLSDGQARVIADMFLNKMKKRIEQSMKAKLN